MSVIKLLERNIMKLSAEALVHELCHVRNALNVQFELYGEAVEIWANMRQCSTKKPAGGM